jgi:hypothetical protein
MGLFAYKTRGYYTMILLSPFLLITGHSLYAHHKCDTLEENNSK